MTGFNLIFLTILLQEKANICTNTNQNRQAMRRRIGIALFLIGVLLVSSIVVFYFTEASVNYSLSPYVYQRVGNYWFTATDYFNQSNPLINGTFTTIECQNIGLFDANFKIEIKLSNATFSKQDFLQSQFVDNNKVVLSYNLHSQEKKSTDVNFTMENDLGFDVSISFQTNQLLIRQTETNWGEQTHFSYGNLGYYENHTLAPALIS